MGMNSMNPEASYPVVVWAGGPDRPGMIAVVATMLYEKGANLEHCAMTQLSGHFTMVMLVSSPVNADELGDYLRSGLAQTHFTDLSVTVRARPLGSERPLDGQRCMVSVYGKDRPGIVAVITTLLAEQGVNVTDATTSVLDAGESVYALLLEVVLPDGLDVAELGPALSSAAQELGVDASIRPIAVDVF